MRALAIAGLLFALLVVALPEQAPTHPAVRASVSGLSLREREFVLERAVAHHRYVANQGRGHVRRWHHRALAWTRRELAEVRAQLAAAERLRTLSATATAYCLTGSTATGAPAGPGAIAVDPDVIPLGSRLHVSGYGPGRALDTGSAIQGHRIDVWLPCSAAVLWGVRRVTVEVLR